MLSAPISITLSTVFLLSSLTITSVYGDGLFEENLSASFGERKANLVIKMTPPVITTETLMNKTQKPLIEFQLFDSTTNRSFSHVTYFITIEKGWKEAAFGLVPRPRWQFENPNEAFKLKSSYGVW